MQPIQEPIAHFIHKECRRPGGVLRVLKNQKKPDGGTDLVRSELAKVSAQVKHEKYGLPAHKLFDRNGNELTGEVKQAFIEALRSMSGDVDAPARAELDNWYEMLYALLVAYYQEPPIQMGITFQVNGEQHEAVFYTPK